MSWAKPYVIMVLLRNLLAQETEFWPCPPGVLGRVEAGVGQLPEGGPIGGGPSRQLLLQSKLERGTRVDILAI